MTWWCLMHCTSKALQLLKASTFLYLQCLCWSIMKLLQCSSSVQQKYVSVLQSWCRARLCFGWRFQCFGSLLPIHWQLALINSARLLAQQLWMHFAMGMEANESVKKKAPLMKLFFKFLGWICGLHTHTHLIAAKQVGVHLVSSQPGSSSQCLHQNIRKFHHWDSNPGRSGESRLS